MSLFPSDRYYRSRTTQFFIRGAPDGAEAASLYIGPQYQQDLSATLFMAAPPGETMSLIIGQDTFASGALTLYSSGFEGGGGTDFQSQTTLRVAGIANNGTPDVVDVPLFINGPDSVAFNDSADLNIQGEPPLLASGSLTLFTSGGGPTTTNPVLDTVATSLYIGNFAEYNTNTTLHMETDFNYGTTSSLFVKSSFSSGVIPISVEGAEVEADSIPLYIKVPVSSGVPLFNRGFLE
jgi:hypothetical protein